ncbi:MAG: magnesium transporter [Cereibacter sphaeroides]|uniref:Magnesium transport protein CorA n=1 Tax=Cereibacter sphaeroides TaxID=1063 RepID=A0A2W5SJF7_CERSP|nr:MAG: magnesium transporter [Cereibacter sphaeroides]
MIFAYRQVAGRLERIPAAGALDSPDTEALEQAAWIDLYRPLDSQVQKMAAIGIPVPSLADMEEIELSSRLYRENGLEFMTVVLPGHSTSHEPVAGPVTFILSDKVLVTVRHHAPRPFETYPERADKVGPGCIDSDRIFLSLIEEIIGRLADLLEASGRELDHVAREVFKDTDNSGDNALRALLLRIGREGEQISRVRLALLTIERALSFYGTGLAERAGAHALKPLVKTLVRDIQALEVHTDFVSSRVSLASDATLGVINLAQAQTIKIFSVLAVVFLPPTVIASAYGMNFEIMPELKWTFGYPMALLLMVASAVGTYAFFKWRKLL